MKKALVLSFVALATSAFAASGSYKVNVLQDSVIEGKAIKAGQYKVSVENGNAVFTSGKNTIAVPAREETQSNKVSTTEMIYSDSTNLQEIRVGGTHTKITFTDASSMHSGS